MSADKNMIVPPDLIPVDAHTDEVCCDGGGVLGHPTVWYSFDGNTRVKCLYCDRLFVKTSA